jgi:hypothetical protein
MVSRLSAFLVGGIMPSANNKYTIRVVKTNGCSKASWNLVAIVVNNVGASPLKPSYRFSRATLQSM